MTHLFPGDRVAFKAREGCWVTAVVVAVHADGTAEVERGGGAETWRIPADSLHRVRR